MLKIPLFIVALLGAAAVWPGASASPGAHGPNGEHLDAPSNQATTGLARLPDGSVNVPKQAQRRMAIRTVMAHEGEHPLSVELNAVVGIDPNAGGRVQAPFAGRIVPGPKGLPVTGQRVDKGQVLVRIEPLGGAIERANQKARLVELRSDLRLAARRVERLESLEGTVPQKEIEAAREELKSLTGREREVAASIGGSESIVAPASGVIATARVLSGQIVEAKDLLFEVTDPGRMMVEASTTDVSLAGRIGSAALLGYPQVALRLIGAGRSLRDGALPISFRASAAEMPLAIGQPVSVVAQLNTKAKGIALPADAVVRNQSNESIVWIKAGAERFIPQAIEFLPLDANNIVVVKGLGPDNRVVISGTALINQIR